MKRELSQRQRSGEIAPPKWLSGGEVGAGGVEVGVIEASFWWPRARPRTPKAPRAPSPGKLASSERKLMREVSTELKVLLLVLRYGSYDDDWQLRLIFKPVTS